MTIGDMRFGFPVWDLAGEHDKVPIREHVRYPRWVDVWRGDMPLSHIGPPAENGGPGVLVRSYSLAAVTEEQAAPEPSAGYGMATIANRAISEVVNIPEVIAQLPTTQPITHLDTVLLVDGVKVPAMEWDLGVQVVSVIVSASLLTHPFAVVTWGGRLTTPITLKALAPDGRDSGDVPLSIMG
jgi:hypothetical protein